MDKQSSFGQIILKNILLKIPYNLDSYITSGVGSLKIFFYSTDLWVHGNNFAGESLDL